MTILSLDMSSQKTGFALFVDDNLIDYGVWILTKEDNNDWRERILFMANHISEYILQHNIDIIYAEDVPPSSKNAMTLKILSALQGCLITICHLNNIELQFVPVKTWKNKININLTGSKQYNSAKKLFKGAKLTMFKKQCKAYEKKLSVDNVNYYFNTKLVWKSVSSKYNQDDISDAINIALSTMDNKYTYCLDSFDKIINNIKKSIL